MKTENFRASELGGTSKTVQDNLSLYPPDEKAQAYWSNMTCLGLYKGVSRKEFESKQFFFFFLCCDPIATGIERVNEPFEWWCTNFHPEFMERDMLLHPPTTLLFLIFEKQSGRIWWDLSEWWLSSVTFILMHIFVGFVQKNFIWIHKSVHKCV